MGGANGTAGWLYVCVCLCLCACLCVQVGICSAHAFFFLPISHAECVAARVAAPALDVTSQTVLRVIFGATAVRMHR